MKKVKTLIALVAVVVAVAACAVCFTACGSTNYAAQYEKLSNRCEKVAMQVTDGKISVTDASSKLADIKKDADELAAKIAEDDSISEDEMGKIKEKKAEYDASYDATAAIIALLGFGSLSGLWG